MEKDEVMLACLAGGAGVAEAIARCAVREIAPAALEAAGLEGEAARLAALPPDVPLLAAWAAAYAAYRTAWGARAAAWSADAPAGAEDAAAHAARAAADAAAWAAAWEASHSDAAERVAEKAVDAAGGAPHHMARLLQVAHEAA